MRVLAHRGSESPFYFQEGTWGTTMYDVSGVASNADGSIICASTWPHARRSTDRGKTFNTITPNPYRNVADYDDWLFTMRYVNGYFVDMGYSEEGFIGSSPGTWYYYSTDGSDGSWTLKLWTSDPDYGYPYDICYGGGKYLIALSSAYIVYFSNLGDAATAVNIGYGKYSCAYGNSVYVVPGNSGNIKYSSDCATWTAASTPSFGTTVIRGICYGDKFVAVGESGKIGYSTDGNNWTQATSPVSGILYKVKYGVNMDGVPSYYAVGASGKIIRSPDGITWTEVLNSGFSSSAIYDIATSPTSIVAVGASGKIRYAYP
jgi:hypothetical protein